MDEAENSSDEDFDAAERHIARREFSAAAKLLRRVVEAEPKHGVAWRLIGDCSRDMEHHLSALDAYNAALALRPADAEAYFGRGAAWLGAGHGQQAIEDFLKALELNPQYAEAALEIGQAGLHYWQDYRHRVADYLRLAVRLKSDWDDPRFYFGLAYYQTGEWSRRGRAFRRALEVDPDWAEGYYIVGRIAAQTGEMQERKVIEAFQSAVRLRPDWVKAWLALGQAHSDSEDWEAAAEAYRQAVALDAANGEAYLGLGTVYQNLEQWPEALAAYRAAAEHSPSLPEVHYHLGEAHNEAGLPREAEAAFRRALELRPGLAEAHYGIGAACFRQGDNDGAREQIDILLQLDQELAQELYSRCFLTEDA